MIQWQQNKYKKKSHSELTHISNSHTTRWGDQLELVAPTLFCVSLCVLNAKQPRCGEAFAASGLFSQGASAEVSGSFTAELL